MGAPSARRAIGEQSRDGRDASRRAASDATIHCSHDVYHVAEVNGVLGAAGLPQVDLWD